MSKPVRIILLVLKVAVSAGLVASIVSSSNISEILAGIRSADPWLVLAAFSLLFVGYFITAFRWQNLLRAQRVEVPLLRLVQSFMVAVFFNNFLPSTIGGDLMRMYDSYRYGGTRSGAVSVVLVDRFFGVSALLLYALAALALSPAVRRQIPFLPLWLAVALAGAGFAAWLIFGSAGRLHRLLAELDRTRLRPARLLRKVLAAFEAFKGRRDVLLIALGLSLLLQLNVVLHYALVARALGITVPPLALFVIVPVATVAMMLPVSINAIGVRETVFAYLFALFLVPREQAVAFAWIAFGFILAQGVLGGIVFALRRHTARPDLPPAQTP